VNWLVLGVVVATLLAIVARPRGLGEASAAAAGATAMLALGAVAPDELVDIGRETADVLLFLLGMMVLTWLVEQAGVFDRLADGVAGLAGGSGLRLFALVFAFAAVITALLSLDVTVLVLTPIVYALATRRRLDALPFMFACTVVANTGSLLLPISNLTNLLVYNQLGLGFGVFAMRMWVPNLLAVATNLGVFLWLFRDRLPRQFDAAPGDLPPIDWWFATATIALAATLVGLLASGLNHQPLARAARAGGGALLLVGLADRRVRLGDAGNAVSWSLFVFIAGMFVVVRGFEQV
jgi:arsenical pump membrane protein